MIWSSPVGSPDLVPVAALGESPGGAGPEGVAANEGGPANLHVARWFMDFHSDFIGIW
jgi:hypothetical protein